MERERIKLYLMEKESIRPSLKGFDYLTEAILLLNKDSSYKQAITKRLYPDIAKIYNDTWSKVERAMRHAVRSSKKYKLETVSDFLSRILIELRIKK